MCNAPHEDYLYDNKGTITGYVLNLVHLHLESVNRRHSLGILHLQGYNIYQGRNPYQVENHCIFYTANNLNIESEK